MAIETDCTLHVSEVNRIDDVDGLANAWDDLLAITPDASFFLTRQWLAVYWKHFGRTQRLRVLVIEDDHRIVGIVPMVVRTESRKVGAVRVLTFPLDDWGSLYGPLGACDPPLPAATLDHLAHTDRDWDLLDLRFLAQTEEPAACYRKAMLERSWSFQEQVRDHTSIIELPASWEDYFASLPSKFRNNLKRYERRIADRGTLSHTAFRPERGCDDPRWDLYDDCLRVAERSWQGSSETGTTLSHPQVRDFLRETHAVATRLGSVDLHLLYLNEQPLGFTYNYHWQGQVFGLRIGFDASLSRDGVGNTIYTRAIRHAIEQGDTRYDMGPGSLPCKRPFADHVLPIAHLQYYHPRAARAQLLRLKHWLTDPPVTECPLPGR